MSYFHRMLLAGIATAVLVLIGVGVWCAWRFLKKKRPSGEAVLEDDEKDLVGDDENEPEEVEETPQNTDFKGRIHYRLEYDFTTQELKVTVINHPQAPKIHNLSLKTQHLQKVGNPVSIIYKDMIH